MTETSGDPVREHVERIAAAIHAALPTAAAARIDWDHDYRQRTVTCVRDISARVLWDREASQPDTDDPRLFSGYYGYRRPWIREQVRDLEEAVRGWVDLVGTPFAARRDARVLRLPGAITRLAHTATPPPDGTPPALPVPRLAEAFRTSGRTWAPHDASRSGYTVARSVYLDQNPTRTDGPALPLVELGVGLYPGELVVGHRRLGQDWCCPITDPAERDALTALMRRHGWFARYSGRHHITGGDPNEPWWFLVVRRPTAIERALSRPHA
jgi:hypothetical protein